MHFNLRDRGDDNGNHWVHRYTFQTFNLPQLCLFQVQVLITRTEIGLGEMILVP